MGSRDKNPWHIGASLQHPHLTPVTAQLGYFCFAGRWNEGQEEEKHHHHFLQMYLSPDKSCQQPAEGMAEQTLLGTCNTSISLLSQSLSVKANPYHRHTAGQLLHHSTGKQTVPCHQAHTRYDTHPS